MRPIDIRLAVDTCRTAADEMQAAAALDVDLTPAERRHLLAIAAAVRALVEPEPEPAPEQPDTAAGLAQPLPGSSASPL